jgi:acetyl esterase/lipase
MSGKLIDEQKSPLWPKQAPGARGDGNDDVATLTPYLPSSTRGETATGSAMIVCPGGGYGALADHEGAPIARWLNSVGITAFVLHYRLPARGYRHPTPFNDVSRAVRTVRANAKEWGLDSARIGVLGFSAGGQLAATLSVHFDEASREPTKYTHRVAHESARAQSFSADAGTSEHREADHGEDATGVFVSHG